MTEDELARLAEMQRLAPYFDDYPDEIQWLTERLRAYAGAWADIITATRTEHFVDEHGNDDCLKHLVGRQRAEAIAEKHGIE